MNHNADNQKRHPAGQFMLGAIAALFLVVLTALLGGFEFSTNDTIVNNPGGDAKGLARTMAVLGVAPEIEDGELTAMIESLRARAADGDVAAARFIAELAHLQRKAETPPDDPDTSANSEN